MPLTPDPPRVLYSFPHALGRAGIAETALQQVRGLARAGVPVVLFCTSAIGVELPPGVELHQTLVVAGRRIPHRAFGVQRAYDLHDRRVAAWLRRHPGEVDVVHAWPRGCLRTLRTAAELGIAALRESPNAHTTSTVEASAAAAADAGIPLPPDHSHAASASVLAQEDREYRVATAVLVPSDYARREFVRQGFPEERLLQHRYGCDLQRFPARGTVPPHPFRAVFIGRGDPTKGLHVALEAWLRAAIPGGELLIAGRIQPDYEASLLPLLAETGVRRLGFVDDVPGLLGTADVLLLPSWTEGSALVILEAQASGCVPLVSDAGGALGVAGEDYLEHRVGDAATLADQLRALASDPVRLARLSAHLMAGRDALGWDAAATTLIARYREAVALRTALPAPPAPPGR
ncbi:glycosyltransferase family 4 protein [Leifsonia sp. NPDC058194]|uniref:glycosyltransferase family 4 protein n=1 Tax=Leifsonia sp. NPDC058194 TaxID=3346374 RepID=UPI0036DA6076